MIRVHLAASLLAVALGLAPGAAAQRPSEPGAGPDSARAAALAAVAALRPGAWVVVTTVDERLSGLLVRRDSAGLVVAPHGRERTVPLAAVTGLWEADGRATGPGARAGAIALGALGLAVGLYVGGFWCAQDCVESHAQGGAVGLGVGAAAGALVGAALGSISPRWHQRFP